MTLPTKVDLFDKLSVIPDDDQLKINTLKIMIKKKQYKFCYSHQQKQQSYLPIIFTLQKLKKKMLEYHSIVKSYRLSNLKLLNNIYLNLITKLKRLQKILDEKNRNSIPLQDLIEKLQSELLTKRGGYEIQAKKKIFILIFIFRFKLRAPKFEPIQDDIKKLQQQSKLKKNQLLKIVSRTAAEQPLLIERLHIQSNLDFLFKDKIYKTLNQNRVMNKDEYFNKGEKLMVDDIDYLNKKGYEDDFQKE